MSTTVHDALFKSTFSQVEHASGELRVLLPPGLVARIDFATLELCPGSFVDEELAQRHTDLLFTAGIAGRPAYIYVLFEHQSTVTPLMPFRLLSYMVRIWSSYLAEHPDAKRLPAILPAVLHHSDTGWTSARAFEELLDIDDDIRSAIAEYVPRFRFLLDDLSREPEEALRARAMSAFGRLVLLCLQNARNPEQLLAQLGRWAPIWREVARVPHGMAALATVFRYIWEAHDRISVEELRALIAQEVGKDVEEAIVTAADLLREEGRKEGQRALLLKLLTTRFGPLPEDFMARLMAARTEEIERWADRVLTAPTLADVMADT